MLYGKGETETKLKAPLKDTFNFAPDSNWTITAQIALLLKRTDEKRNKWRETRRQGEAEAQLK